ncbi:cystathionine beta-lyase [Pantoea sp. Mhis]|uniref:cystathionine beta-lyase n=1 Tax=Pantoea sp. Mhis TaxID=2576759 RepID=UPI00135ACD82|nr:cystathionine beta-lyase [Pantoea sp. Mhis]MXP56699.1 cystathionine beta-lyase [Pantoea sp. Mhis]
MSSTTKIDTTLVTAGRQKHYTQGSINSVIQRASSLIFDTVADKERAEINCTNRVLFYGRRGTLTHFALQEAMTELEGGAGCVLYPCGAAAISNTILAFVNAFDHVLMSSAVYEPTQDFCTKILSKLNVSTTFFDHCIGGSELNKFIQSNTRVIFLESPASITMEVQNIRDIVTAIRNYSPNIVIILDNTWSAGILFHALEHGIDISIQSGTKYLIGHSDGMIGTAVANKRCYSQLCEHSYLMGQIVDADTAYLASRGLRTLGTRLRQHEESALKIAEWLSKQSKVARVNHPALSQSKGHNFWKRDFNGSSGLFSFILHEKLSPERLANYLDNFIYFKMAYSWGGYESLILAKQPEELARIRILGNVDFKGTLIRLHIGLEHVEDLLKDLKAGFDRLNYK